jgi:ATP-dependent RNA helicase DeaD
VLLATGDAKAILFCRTREGVGELHQRLVDLGFKAAAISGERAQGERDRALEALREGRARVLVATNVAARGLDLPDVDLVVHADLPENAEALTHRSGRTGRAGKKGTSMVIADVAERRKAERLLTSARLSVRWTPAPTADEVRRALEERLVETLLDGGGEAAPARPELAEVAARLRARLPDEALVSLLLAREVGRLPAALPLEPLSGAPRPTGPPLAARERVGSTGPRSTGPGAPDARGPRGWDRAVIFRVNLGGDAKAEPGWLLPLICRRGGVTRREVGAIRIGQRSSTFEIAAEAADDFALASSRPDPRAPHVTIEPVASTEPHRPAAAHEPRGLRPPGAPPAHRPHRPGPRPEAAAPRGGAAVGARFQGRAHGHRRPPDQAR